MTRYNIAPVAASQAGFTYLWALLLVFLTGLGLTAAVEVDSISVQRDKERELLAIGRQFRTAIGRYYETELPGNRHEYPETLEVLLKDNRASVVRRHLRKVFRDPMTGKAEWGVIRLGGRIVALHSLSQKTPIKQAGFEADDAGFTGAGTYSDWVFVYPPDLLQRRGSDRELSNDVPDER